MYVGGRKVVDLWGGVADRDAGTPYTEDSLQLVFSTTKGATAACANLLAQRGELDIDAPVAEYWPEFKAHGKGDIPVRWLLCHKAGLPYVDATLTLEEALAWDPMVRPWRSRPRSGSRAPPTATTPPPTAGWWARSSGASAARASAPSSTTSSPCPLDLEFWIGLPDEQQARVAPLIQWGDGTLRASGDADPAMKELIAQFLGPDSLLGKALGAPNNVLADADGGFNNPAIRAAEIPAANGVTNARSLARFYAGLTGTVEGGPSEPILTEEQVAKASELQTSGPDKCLFFETTFGLGFFVASLFAPYGGERSFGHTGAGRLGRLHRSRARHRVRLRHEQDDGRPQRRPSLRGPHPSGLRAIGVTPVYA